MAKKLRAYTDEENQIVRMEVVGRLEEQDVLELNPEIERAVDALKDPFHVSLLIDGRYLEKSSTRARRAILPNVARDNLIKVAIWGVTNPIVRTIGRFICIASGRNTIRFFSTENDGLDWLLRG